MKEFRSIHGTLLSFTATAPFSLSLSSTCLTAAVEVEDAVRFAQAVPKQKHRHPQRPVQAMDSLPAQAQRRLPSPEAPA